MVTLIEPRHDGQQANPWAEQPGAARPAAQQEHHEVPAQDFGEAEQGPTPPEDGRVYLAPDFGDASS